MFFLGGDLATVPAPFLGPAHRKLRQGGVLTWRRPDIFWEDTPVPRLPVGQIDTYRVLGLRIVRNREDAARGE